jgi:tubulin alpha
MVREILTLSVGQAGIQCADTIWTQYRAEHKLDGNGYFPNEGKEDPQIPENDNWKTFFNESNVGKKVPRNLMVDLEQAVCDDVKKGKNANLYHKEWIISGKEDAANNFARGHYTTGKEIMDQVNDRVKNMVEDCDNLQGFIMSHAVGGGSGSGLGMLILERLAVDYRKKSKIGFEIYPSPSISTCIVEPYNGLLSTHWLLDHTDVSLILDNEALYHIGQKNLDLKSLSYGQLNRLIAKVVSSMTAALRFEGELNVDMNEFQTNLVPFPRLHFMTTSLAPVATKEKRDREQNDCWAICEAALNQSNFFVKYTDFDVVEDKYMAISLNFRGEVKSKEVNETIQKVKKQNKVSFVEWMPTGFKVGLNKEVAAGVENDPLADAKNSVVMIGNNIAINRVFSERLSKKYDMMYSQRAYVHWYVGEGMEEGEFSEAREDLGFLEKDYLDVVTEQASDEQQSESGDGEF